MDMKGAEIPPECLLLLDADVLEILVPEHNDSPLGDEERELIFLQIVQRRQLQAADLSANDRGQLRGFDAWVVLGEQVRLLLVRHEAAVHKVKRLQGTKVGFLVVDWQVVRVLVLGSGQLPGTLLLPHGFAGSASNQLTCWWISLSYANVKVIGAVSTAVVVMAVVVVDIVLQ